MNIVYRGYFNLPHSWANVSQNMTRAFMELGHECSVENTGPGGSDNIPDLFRPLLDREFDRVDLFWSYTIPANWNKRFLKPARCRAAMYAYESSILPKKRNRKSWADDWGNMHVHVDKVLVPSHYVKGIFESNGTPAEKIEIVHHGVDTAMFNEKVPPLDPGTKKSFRFLAVAAPQWRKNLHQLIAAFVSTFSAEDDVCLVIKTSRIGDRPKKSFEYDVEKSLGMYTASSGCPEVKVIYDYMTDLAPLYTACDCYLNVSSAEGFGIPLLEAMACGLITVAPRYGGVLEFMNDRNSILLDCREVCADRRYQFWDYNPGAKSCQPSLDDLKDKMRYVFHNRKKILAAKRPHMKRTVAQFQWLAAARKMLKIVGG